MKRLVLYCLICGLSIGCGRPSTDGSGGTQGAAAQPTMGAPAATPAAVGDFDSFVARLRASPGGVAANVGKFYGQPVDWELIAMGYESNTAPGTWTSRLRLFSGSLAPMSDLGAVMGSHNPVIVALLPDKGIGFEGLNRSERVRVSGRIWGVGPHGALFLGGYRVTRLVGQPAAPTPAVASPPSGTATAPAAGFDELYAQLEALPGGFKGNVGRYAGTRVSWRLHSMGYEATSSYDSSKPTNFTNWSERMRLYSGSLKPKSDLGEVWNSKNPIIVAVLPKMGKGYRSWKWGDTLEVEASIWGIDEGELFLEDYRIKRASGK